MRIKLLIIHEFLLYLMIFFLPWQTLWIIKDFLYAGEKWQYGTIGIYISDILLMTWIMSGFFLHKRGINNYFRDHKKIVIAAVVFVLWVLLSILWAQNMLITVYFAAKIALFILAFVFLHITPMNTRVFVYFFVISVSIHCLIGLYQFVTQDTFSSTLFGIHGHDIWQGSTATITSETGRWLRAYGGMTHPNIMGGFALIALLLSTWLYLTCKKSFLKITLLLSVISIIFLNMITTYSRSTWIAAVIALISLCVYVFTVKNSTNIKHRMIPIIFMFFALPLTMIFFYPDVFFARSQSTEIHHNSFIDRQQYIAQAYTSIKKRPFLGTGVGNFTNTVAQDEHFRRPLWSYQPVHNIYLLILAEIGVVGFVSFFIIIFSVLYDRKCFVHRNFFSVVVALSLVSLLIIGLFDHWIWSSHAGLLLFFILLGLFSSRIKKPDDNTI